MSAFFGMTAVSSLIGTKCKSDLQRRSLVIVVAILAGCLSDGNEKAEINPGLFLNDLLMDLFDSGCQLLVVRGSEKKAKTARLGFFFGKIAVRRQRIFV